MVSYVFSNELFKDVNIYGPIIGVSLGQEDITAP